MKCIRQIILIIIFSSFEFAVAVTSFNKFVSIAPAKQSESNASIQKPKSVEAEVVLEPPSLSSDEYAIFIKDKYLKFKIKKFQGLELDLSCFKGKIPKCEAYEFSQIKPKSLMMKNEAFNNMAAIFCEAVHGRNLLALDKNRNEYNFCRFPDDSMVNSWSLYYKHFPQKK